MPKHLISVPSGVPPSKGAASGVPVGETAARVTLLDRVVRQLRASPVAGVTAVLRPGDFRGERVAREAGAEVAFAWPAREGRAASVRAGIRARPDADGWLFALCDQPLLGPPEFAALIARFESSPASIVCAAYGGERGSPTLFPARLRRDLLALEGFRGGRHLLARHAESILRVELDPALGRDLDAPEDVAALFGVDLPLATATMRPVMSQRTLSIVKPDAVSAQHTGAILQAIEESGLRIVALRMLQLTPEQAESFYAVHRERPFFKSLCEFMISGPIVVSALEGEDAIAKYRTLMGATNPEQAADGTLRKRFATNVERNAVHGSDAPETAQAEISFFFPDLG